MVEVRDLLASVGRFPILNSTRLLKLSPPSCDYDTSHQACLGTWQSKNVMLGQKILCDVILRRLICGPQNACPMTRSGLWASLLPACTLLISAALMVWMCSPRLPAWWRGLEFSKENVQVLRSLENSVCLSKVLKCRVYYTNPSSLT